MKKTIRIVIIIHFLFVLLTVSHVYELIKYPPLSELMEIYSSFTYTNRNFGFFAPTVNEDFTLSTIVFKHNDSIGQKLSFYLPNSENKIRFTTMLWHFSEGNSDAQMDLYARSWAIYYMNKDNNNNAIDSLVISVYKNFIPSMEEYRIGKRIEQNLYYQTTIYAK